ncbi:MAG: hypothetical protein N2Z76_01300 [Treponemataceae bacterium]|nr:hypothetical protein [Treponemataceae bacterium]
MNHWGLRILILGLLVPFELGAQLHGSINGTVNYLFWHRDDMLQSAFTDTVTRRENPLFYRFQVSLENLFGCYAGLAIFTDKILAPFGIFNRDLSVQTGVTYGGTELDLIGPDIREVSFVQQALKDWFDWDIQDIPFPMYPEVHYRARTMRWTTEVEQDPLSGSQGIVYYDGIQDPIFSDQIQTGSFWDDLQLGLSAVWEFGSVGLLSSLRLRIMNYTAPAQLVITAADMSALGEVLMVLPTTYVGLNLDVGSFEGSFGETLSSGWKFGLGMGPVFQENVYLKNRAFAMELYGQFQWAVPFDDERKSGLVLGIDAFGIIIMDGSLEAEDTLKKDILVSTGNTTHWMNSGPVDISFTTTDGYAIPYVKLVWRF